MKFIIAVFILLPVIAFANPSPSTHSASSAENDGDYIEKYQWHLSIAIGYGDRANPLADGDEQPLFIYPDIAYYGERFYFDNGDFGYTLSEHSNYSISWLTHLNSEKYYFLDQLPANIIFPPNSIVARPTLQEIPKRKYAIDTGLDMSYYLTANSMLRFQAMTDISRVYKGTNAKLEYFQAFRHQDLNLAFVAGLSWKSQRLVDYYYGLDLTELENDENNYRGKATLNPYVKLSLNYPLSESWSFVSFAKHEQVGSGIKNSPLVDRSSLNSYFIGVSYEF